MAELVSMKYSDADRKARETETLASPSYEGEQYPWGLSLNLDDATMKKLGVKSLAAGQELTLLAKVRVTSASSYSREGRDDETSVGLQITDMALDLPSAGTPLTDLYKDG